MAERDKIFITLDNVMDNIACNIRIFMRSEANVLKSMNKLYIN